MTLAPIYDCCHAILVGSNCACCGEFVNPFEQQKENHTVSKSSNAAKEGQTNPPEAAAAMEPSDKKPELQTGASTTDVSVPNTTAVVTTPKPDANGVPDYVTSRSSGRGVSTAAEDNIVPLVYVLQPLSPQVQRTNPAYIEGAEAGDIWLKNSSQPIVKGNVGIVAQPVTMWKKWVEWKPRESGGGFVASYDNLPEDVRTVTDPKNPNKSNFFRPNGNIVNETRYQAVIIHVGNLRLPYVIPFTSTGHTVSRGWMNLQNAKRRGDGSIVDAFASVYRLKTRVKTNNLGTWFVLEPTDMNQWVAESDYNIGESLYQAFATGAKVADTLDQDHVEGDTTSGGDNSAM